MGKDQIIVMNLCGRGDKDIFTVGKILGHGALDMTTRIDRRMAALKSEGRPALVTYFMAGDPDYATSLSIMKALPGAGSDIIELGMPFSDPMADGPAIQAAGLRALKGGQTLVKTLQMARDFRKDDDDDADRADGLLQPDLRLRRRALPHGRASRRASTG